MTDKGPVLRDSIESEPQQKRYRALWDFEDHDAEALHFTTGQVIELSETIHSDWGYGFVVGENSRTMGYFPMSRVFPCDKEKQTVVRASLLNLCVRGIYR
jgi:hypothetical protein